MSIILLASIACLPDLLSVIIPFIMTEGSELPPFVEKDFSNLRILVVEDSESYYPSIYDALRRAGLINGPESRDLETVPEVANLTFVTSGFEALKEIRDGGYGLVLLDYNLGSGVNGREILARIPNFVKQDALPLVIGIAGDETVFKGQIPCVSKGRYFEENLDEFLSRLVSPENQ